VDRSQVEERLRELGIQLPDLSPPAANYVPFTFHAGVVYLAGQIPFENGKLRYSGVVGADLMLEDGYQAARLCGINLLANLRLACSGDLGRVTRCLRVGGFVNSAPAFFDQAKVINGCSDLFGQIFGDAGRHARTAISATPLPFNAAVEVDAIFAVES
jgi:enamine deaminase RidA (YjgF/YER057c/UK114 family)